MRLEQAKKLKPGDHVTAIVEVPEGADAFGRPGYIPGIGYQHDPIKPGDVLKFQKIIPKVVIVKRPWYDGHEEMLLCEMNPGQRAWLNIGNALKIP